MFYLLKPMVPSAWNCWFRSYGTLRFIRMEPMVSPKETFRFIRGNKIKHNIYKNRARSFILLIFINLYVFFQISLDELIINS